MKVIFHKSEATHQADYIKFEKMQDDQFYWAYQTKDGGTNTRPYGIISRDQLLELVTGLQKLLVE